VAVAIMTPRRGWAALDRRTFLARVAAAVAGTMMLGRAEPARAEDVPYLGEIMLFAGGYAPRGWALCHGQLLPINQNQALFSLLGTTYGGNGQTTFALPDLRDRVPIHFGEGVGLTARILGERSGESAHTLTVAEIPAHTHLMRASSALATSVTPAGMYPAQNPAGYAQYVAAPPDVAMSSTGVAGSSQAHDNLQPCLGLHFVIALQGVFPPH
jgi:microcystin-dependent protein